MGKTFRYEPSVGNAFIFFQSYKELAEFYWAHNRIKTEEQIKERIKFIVKNKPKDRSELEVLYWILGEKNDEENFNKTKNATRTY